MANEALFQPALDVLLLLEDAAVEPLAVAMKDRHNVAVIERLNTLAMQGWRSNPSGYDRYARQLGAAGADPLLVVQLDRQLDDATKEAAGHALVRVGASAVRPLIDQLRDYGSSVTGAACLTLLGRILEQHASQITLDDLRASVELSLSYTSQQYESRGREDEFVTVTEHTVTVDCSTVNNLARAELARRGENP